MVPGRCSLSLTPFCQAQQLALVRTVNALPYSKSQAQNGKETHQYQMVNTRVPPEGSHSIGFLLVSCTLPVSLLVASPARHEGVSNQIPGS